MLLNSSSTQNLSGVFTQKTSQHQPLQQQQQVVFVSTGNGGTGALRLVNSGALASVSASSQQNVIIDGQTVIRGMAPNAGAQQVGRFK